MLRALLPLVAIALLTSVLLPATPASAGCVRAPQHGMSIRVASSGAAGFQPGCAVLIDDGRIVFTNVDKATVAVIGPCFMTGHLEPGTSATITFLRDENGALHARDPFALTPCAPAGENADLPYHDAHRATRTGRISVELDTA